MLAVLLVVNVTSVNVKFVPTLVITPLGLYEKPLEALLAMVVLDTVSPVKFGTAVAMRIPAFPLFSMVEFVMTTSVTAAVLLNATPAPWLSFETTFDRVM